MTPAPAPTLPHHPRWITVTKVLAGLTAALFLIAVTIVAVMEERPPAEWMVLLIGTVLVALTCLGTGLLWLQEVMVDMWHAMREQGRREGREEVIDQLGRAYLPGYTGEHDDDQDSDAHVVRPIRRMGTGR